MTSHLGRESLTTLTPGPNSRTPRGSHRSSESFHNVQFNQNGHPYFDEADPVHRSFEQEGRRLPRPFSSDTIRHNYLHGKGEEAGPGAISHQHSSEDSLRHEKETEPYGLPRAPDPVYRQKRSRHPSSSLWIRDSEGRPIIEIGLKEGRYIPGDPNEEEKTDRADRASREAASSQNTDEEKGKEGPPKPVGFWDKSLSKTRLLVLRRWAFMSWHSSPSA